MSNAPRAFAALLDERGIMRSGWRNRFYLAAQSVEGLSPPAPNGDGDSDLVILRINEDGTRWPWTPTEDDLFATDWFTQDGVGLFSTDGPDGTAFPAALHAIQSGHAVGIGDGPLRLVKGETHGGPCIDIVLPGGGGRKLWRPQHQDLWGVYRVLGAA